MAFEEGIRYYTPMNADVTVYFPEDKVCCQYCRLFCRYEDAFSRFSCRLTDEWLMDVKHSVGRLCPLKGEENGTDRETGAYPAGTQGAEGTV